MSNVVRFPGSARFGTVVESGEPDYVITVHWTPNGFDWSIDSESAAPIPEDRVAADMAALSLQLCPPPRTFLERFTALIFGDDQ